MKNDIFSDSKTVHFVADAVGSLLASGAVTATKYVSPTLTIRATRRRYGENKRFSKNPVDISLTIGRPNFDARKFIKVCGQAGEIFPIKKVHLKF